MKLVHIIPIAKGIGRETLSYFTSKDINPGAIVSTKVRNRTITGLVISAESVEESKSNLKEMPFSMKKIEAVLADSFFTKEFMQAVKITADHFACSTGTMLEALTPKRILENISEITITSKEDTHEHNVYKEKFILQASDAERLGAYKSLIREEFAKKQSVFICAPTVEDARNIMANLSKGIEDHAYLLHGGLSKKEATHAWSTILDSEHPVLIVATGIFLGIPKKSISTIILERESSRNYKTSTRPYVDLRFFAEKYATTIGARLILADILLRTETLFRYEQGEFQDYTPLKWRSISSAQNVFVDMKQYQTKQHPEFRLLSDHLLELIAVNKEKNGRLFIFASRRGLSPSVVCKDCGTIVTCNNCSAPIVLHGSTKQDKNFFMCHRCGEKRDAAERCKVCTNWNLVTLGVGIETIEVAIKKAYPDMHVLRLDADTASTSRQARAIAEEFYDSPGSILLGTEMALTYLPTPIEHTAVASIDALFSLPDFRISERIFHILLRIRSLAESIFLLQTRQTDQPIWDLALKGNLTDFYRKEITDRESFDYPPFTTLIKITFSGDKPKVSEEMSHLKSYLDPHELHVFPAFIETVKNKFVMHGLIKIISSTWIDQSLLGKIKGLPPQYAVNVDPENLL